MRASMSELLIRLKLLRLLQLLLSQYFCSRCCCWCISPLCCCCCCRCYGADNSSLASPRRDATASALLRRCNRFSLCPAVCDGLPTAQPRGKKKTNECQALKELTRAAEDSCQQTFRRAERTTTIAAAAADRGLRMIESAGCARVFHRMQSDDERVCGSRQKNMAAVHPAAAVAAASAANVRRGRQFVVTFSNRCRSDCRDPRWKRTPSTASGSSSSGVSKQMSATGRG